MGIEPAALDSFIRLGESLHELEVIIGPAARPVIAEVRTRLADAAARRQSGDTAGALEMIRAAMERMAALAGTLDPAEATMMRMLTDHFANALNMGDKSSAKTAVNAMRHRAGDPKDDPNTEW